MSRTKGPRALGVLSTAALVAAALGVAACSDVLGSSDETATISFRSAAGSRLALQTGSAETAVLAAATVPVTANGHTVDVQQVDLLVDKVKLERAHTGDERDSDAEDEGDSDARNDETFHDGPATITLPLEGGVVSPFSQAIPAGTYDELQMKARYVRVKGTYDGQAFDVTTPVNAKIETRLNPPLVVSTAADKPNVTVNVDWASWFRSGSTVIDPRLLASDPRLAAEFRQRVRASFRALKDNDRNGEDSDRD